uniref:Uncharacterized protein n=1 Tax=Grammatophora oceanica TaxID=210454 RepID=A0A6U5IXA7_9STRA|mmetsp:Transcript_22872/g.33902  ORF Transcript_22872/g.33902 Transcript_22872/m.33902 type:complete len:114 (+) Transcript_22872:57-398(+)
MDGWMRRRPQKKESFWYACGVMLKRHPEIICFSEIPNGFISEAEGWGRMRWIDGYVLFGGTPIDQSVDLEKGKRHFWFLLRPRRDDRCFVPRPSKCAHTLFYMFSLSPSVEWI